jgi:hypothetical protein
VGLSFSKKRVWSEVEGERKVGVGVEDIRKVAAVQVFT